MKLVELILKEHSRAMRDAVVRYVGHNPARFGELVDLFMKGPYRVTQRAAWPLSYCVENHPELAKPHLKRIIQNLKSPGLHDSVKRNTIRLFQFVPIPKSLQGIVADICFEYLANPKEAIAVRAVSMRVLSRIAREQPELKNELRILIEDHLPFASPGFRSRGMKVLKEIKQQ
ncbi:MAG: hypothetical protein HOP08_15805 [Cyclobacteriaceae bacterium]|nr:hypothetical protein [Cyclobacteriaceae bacterium]